jgi:hypothetical protein
VSHLKSKNVSRWRWLALLPILIVVFSVSEIAPPVVKNNRQFIEFRAKLTTWEKLKETTYYDKFVIDSSGRPENYLVTRQIFTKSIPMDEAKKELISPLWFPTPFNTPSGGIYTCDLSKLELPGPVGYKTGSGGGHFVIELIEGEGVINTIKPFNPNATTFTIHEYRSRRWFDPPNQPGKGMGESTSDSVSVKLRSGQSRYF